MLPLEIIRMKAKGCYVYLHGNTPGFTLPSNIGELGDDIVNLDLSQCSLQGITCRVAPERKRENPGSEEPGNEERAGNESKCP